MPIQSRLPNIWNSGVTNAMAGNIEVSVPDTAGEKKMRSKQEITPVYICASFAAMTWSFSVVISNDHTRYKARPEYISIAASAGGS